MKYPAIEPHFLDGEAPITTSTGDRIGRLADFWQWAYSDLLGNVERGVLAEYLVALAVSATHKPRVSFDKYDLITPEGILLEVKSSGYIQSWEQTAPSRLSFDIRPAFGWDATTNTTAAQRERPADIYVFCVHIHEDQATVNPLDISQWEFYLLQRKLLDEQVGNQKTISLAAVKRLGARPTRYERLHETVLELSRAQGQPQNGGKHD